MSLPLSTVVDDETNIAENGSTNGIEESEQYLSIVRDAAEAHQANTHKNAKSYVELTREFARII